MGLFGEDFDSIGGFMMMVGYVGAWLRGAARLDDPELVSFIRAYQLKALSKGKKRAIAEIEARQLARWVPTRT